MAFKSDFRILVICRHHRI